MQIPIKSTLKPGPNTHHGRQRTREQTFMSESDTIVTRVESCLIPCVLSAVLLGPILIRILRDIKIYHNIIQFRFSFFKNKINIGIPR